jgi:ABC-2 type transport system ATP-binding protein
LNPAYLQIRNLSKSFGSLKAVDDLSLDIHQGEIFGLLGPNGAGKTTTIQMVCGLLHPDHGEIILNGQGKPTRSSKVMNKIGFCSQQNILWEKLTCSEHLEFIGAMYHLPAAVARQRGLSLLDQLGLSDKRNQLASELSGGMQRRLNLSLALIHDPDLVILDEPEAGLDPQSRIMVREYIRSMAKGKTVILTTHNMDEADRLSDRVAIIDHGKLLKVDTPENLKKTIGAGDVIELELQGMATEQASALMAEIGITASFTQNHLLLRASNLIEKLPQVLDILRSNGAVIGELRLRSNSLEDVFIDLTGRRLRE